MKKLFAMTAAVLLLFSVLLGIPAAYGQAPETGKTLDILFSHDTHSHLNTFTTVVEDEETDIGGFARANTLIKAQRAKDPDTLVIDGGDFSMGTLIQTVFETQAAELRMLGYMGYDVTTFGNHEFDYRSKGLANMLTSARTSGDAVPALVELQDDKLYRIVADLYSGQMLSAVTDMSYGILSIVPKYADGTPIEDFEDVILTENGKELKGWDAIARYMASFEDTDGDGIGNVPDYYSTLNDRKKVEDSRSLAALLKKPNRFTFILLGIILTAVVLVVCIVLLLRKLVRKLRRGRKVLD